MKKLLALLLVATMMFGLVGCGSTPTTTPADTAEDTEPAETEDTTKETAAQVTEAAEAASGGADMTGKKVGFSALMMSSEFFAGMSDQMEAYFTENGMEYSVADANASAETQMKSIENFVTMGMDYIILFAVDASSICDALISARNQGVFVINIGTVLAVPEAYDVCINVDQGESGRVEAQIAADWIEATFPDAEEGSIEVAIIETTDSEDAKARSMGLEEVVNYTSKAAIVETYEVGNTEGTTKAQEVAEMIFLNHPDVKAILTYGTDLGGGADEIASKNTELNKDEFAIFTVDTPEYIRNKIIASVDNTSLLRGTVMLGEGTPMTCYNLMNGSWMDRIENGIYAERCIAITPETIGEYFE